MQHLGHTYSNNWFMIYLKSKCTWVSGMLPSKLYLGWWVRAFRDIFGNTMKQVVRVCLCAFLCSLGPKRSQGSQKDPQPKTDPEPRCCHETGNIILPSSTSGQVHVNVSPLKSSSSWPEKDLRWKAPRLIIEKNCHFIFKNILFPRCPSTLASRERLPRAGGKAMCAKVSLSLPCQSELGSQHVSQPKGRISCPSSRSQPHSKRCICPGSSAPTPGIETLGSGPAACHFKLSPA